MCNYCKYDLRSENNFTVHILFVLCFQSGIITVQIYYYLLQLSLFL